MAFLSRKVVRIFLGVVAVCLLVWLVRLTDTRHILRLVLGRIDALGPSAPFWFILAYVAACLTFFPGVILTVGGGILFGVVKGTLYVSIGATLGAGCAFLVSRYCARQWVLRKFGDNARFRAVDDAVARDGWKMVGLLRLSPVFPFVPMNFVFGLTRIPFWQFVVVTWFSILPMSLAFVYLGTLAGDLASLGTEPIASGQNRWWLSGAGVVVTVVVSILVAKVARKSLQGRLPENPER